MEAKKLSKLRNPTAPIPVPPPPIDQGVINEQLKQARAKVEQAFKAFHQVLNNKKLERNKSDVEKEQERKISDELFRTAQELDRLNPGEGVMVVGSIGLRELLKTRDRMNEVEYTALLTRKELNELKQQLGCKEESTT